MFALLSLRLPLSRSFLDTLMWISIIYRSGPYPHKNSHGHTHTHTPLSPERGVARQCGRLLDSEVRRCRGGAWPLEQPLWRLVRPPFRMSWMCWTIRLMATEGGERDGARARARGRGRGRESDEAFTNCYPRLIQAETIRR